MHNFAQLLLLYIGNPFEDKMKERKELEGSKKGKKKNSIISTCFPVNTGAQKVAT